MIPVKIQCACGQRYAFDVEPVNGQMPSAVACPACGADGTAAANECIAQALAAAPPPAPAGGLKLQRPAAAQITSAPPPIPPVTGRPAAMPQRLRPTAPRLGKRGKDGWATDETDFNKLGTYLTVIPAIVAALLAWGIFGVRISPMLLCIVVGVCGLAGGVMNLAGRGPVVAGAFIGLLIALGAYGAVFLWIHDRQKVRAYEVAIAFALGAAPGFLLQYVIQQILKKRARAQRQGG
jgi:hypothetical protein